MVDPRSAVLYEVYPQLDALGEEGVDRLLGAFANIETEAEEFANQVFEVYAQRPGEGDMGDVADSAQAESIERYRTLSALKQVVTNLLAVGMYHLFEQHKNRVEKALSDIGRKLPDMKTSSHWAKVGELRLVANTVKHAEGGAAQELRKRRKDLFVDPIISGSALGQFMAWIPKRIENPLGGPDLFVTRADLTEYRDALRGLWDDVLPFL